IDKLILGGRNSNGNFLLTRLNIPPAVSVKEQDNSFATQVIFPNPATDQLYFKKESKFEIMDIQGRILLKSEKFVQSVNVSHLRAGVYFIKFDDKQVRKFVKE
ncbi:MAG: T9SS type A sorting domain-containing protein, partial [Lentimicrobiaceae bacterium]|nr:T9SS type A sorting domain-containing protein [Lentimicrobiaceae bacterium]